METIILVVIALLIYDFVKFTVNFIGEIITAKQWTPRMENPPPPPKRKSFKERLSEYQALANHHGYQPTDKVDTSNPPKETGT